MKGKKGKIKSIVFIVIAVIIIVIAFVAMEYWWTLTPTPAPALKVAFLLPGSITDAGWNAVMYRAAHEVADELNLEIAIAEGLGQVGVEGIMAEYAEKGYKLIFCHTITYLDPALKLAPQYPDTWFIVPQAWEFADNVIGYTTPTWEAAYLAGMVAAGITNTKKIGIVIGFDYPLCVAHVEAFFAGALSIDPNIECKAIAAGVWDDIDKGRECGEVLIEWGADVIAGRGDGLTLGVIQAASIHGVYAIGDLADQHAIAPDCVVTSTLWYPEVVIREIVRMYREGTLEGNREYGWGVAGGEFSIAPFYQFDEIIPDYIKEKINETIEAAKAGTFEFPLITEKIPEHW